MLRRVLGRRRSPLVHYGVLAIMIVVLFVLGARMGSILIELIQQRSSVPASSASGMALVQPPQLIKDFTLTDQDGQPLSLSDLRGQPVLMFFGYTHCPEECPVTMSNFKRIKNDLGDIGNDVHFLFVSVDAERDTPPVVDEFLQHFDENFIGMTGDPANLSETGKQFGLVFENVVLGSDGSQRPATDQDENYFVSHISPSFLIDKDGYMTHVFFYGTKPDVIVNTLREVLS